MINEQELKADISSLMEKFGIKGHLLIYLDEDRLRFIGDLGVKFLKPLIVKMIADKWLK